MLSHEQLESIYIGPCSINVTEKATNIVFSTPYEGRHIDQQLLASIHYAHGKLLSVDLGHRLLVGVTGRPYAAPDSQITINPGQHEPYLNFMNDVEGPHYTRRGSIFYLFEVAEMRVAHELTAGVLTCVQEHLPSGLRKVVRAPMTLAKVDHVGLIHDKDDPTRVSTMARMLGAKAGYEGPLQGFLNVVNTSAPFRGYAPIDPLDLTPFTRWLFSKSNELNSGRLDDKQVAALRRDYEVINSRVWPQ